MSVGDELCEIEGDQRYLVQGQADLYEAFSCIARVGTQGSGTEAPMEAMINALTVESRPGGCNEGFIRPGAILVVTIITDEPDEFSEGDVAAWHDALVTAKSGDDDSIVVLGLLPDNDLPTRICEDYDDLGGTGARPAPRLREFVGIWGPERGKFCSVCQSDYSECFLDAVSIIDMTCDTYVY